MEQATAIHILPNISRKNGNQAMKFGQLIEYNMRSISLEKSYAKCGWETSPKFLSKKSKFSISLFQDFILYYTKVSSYVLSRLNSHVFIVFTGICHRRLCNYLLITTCGKDKAGVQEWSSFKIIHSR